MGGHVWNKVLCVDCGGAGKKKCQQKECHDPQWRQCTEPFPCLVKCQTCDGEGEIDSGGKFTLREMQATLPWTVRYSRDFRANPQSHKDFAHALTHVGKALGNLLTLVDDMDHDRTVADDTTLRDRYGKYVADFVICALRAANTFPSGVLDLEKVVVDRIRTKNPPPKKDPNDPVKWENLRACGTCHALPGFPCKDPGRICLSRLEGFRFPQDVEEQT